jgi:hypothetical protein
VKVVSGGQSMRKLILIGKWFKGKKSTVVDLQAYRELKRIKKERRNNNDPIPQSRKKDE